MNRPVAMTMAILLCSFCFAFTVGAVDAPHYDAATGKTCGTCHTTQLLRGSTGYNNICLNCHRPGDAIADSKPFALADAANPFGIHSTAGVAKAKVMQTSHRWDGSDTNLQFGAKPPLQGQMTTNALRSRTGGEMACVRCHNQHSKGVDGKFLRMANDQDQMCLDCHRSRNVQSHLQGSHPVSVTYNGTKAGFKPIPANSANPTADLSNYLKSGNVSCSTCHGVHYTDSRSSTVDGSASFATLSSSDGYLLRTDRRGITAGAGFDSTTHICTTCHTGKSSHNLKGQDIQCSDCHGAHVEFDPKDPTSSKGVNHLLIRRNVPKGATGSGRIFFRYTSSTRYMNADNSGACQGCHAVPTDATSPDAHRKANATTKDCEACHFHNSRNGSFSGACTNCHGYPPTTATVGGPTGVTVLIEGQTTAATGATASNSPGAHESHAKKHWMACVTCHSGYAAKVMPSNTIDIGFSITGTNYKKFVGTVPVSVVPTFNGTALSSGFTWSVANGTNLTTGNSVITCSVYCHGSTLTGGSATPPLWTKTDGSQKACGACHGTTAATAPVTGSHSIHAGNGAGGQSIPCASCHGIHADIDHVDGSVSWNLRGLSGGGVYKNLTTGSTGAPAPSATYGTCSSISCHSSGQAADGTATPLTYGTPAWGGTLTCNDCHKNMKMDPTAPGSHVTHAQTAKISCATCHNGYTETSFNPVTHDNGFINLVFSGLATGATYSQGDTHPLGNGFGTCSALSCHGQGAPTWGATSNAPVNGFPYSATQCEKCHGSAATNPFYSTAIPKVATNTDAHTGAHTDHLAGTKNISSAIACLECHAVPATVTAAGHLDGTTQVAFVGTLAKANSSTATTCATTWCHGGNTTLIPQNSPARTAPTWGTRFPATSTLGTGGTVGTSGSGYCAQCHGYPPLTTSHAGKTAATCIGCHPHLNSDALTFNDKTKHIDGSIQAANGHSVPFDSHNAEIVAASGNTACLGCHTMGTSASVYPAAGGAAPNCMSCHKKAAPTHTGTTAGANCSSCHGTSTNSTATKKGIPTGAAFPDLRKGHSRGEHNVACTICHVLGTSGGTGSGINHGRGSTAGPVRDGKPNVVGTFVTGITVTGGGVKGASPTTVKCNHNLITGNGCNGNGTNETW